MIMPIYIGIVGFGYTVGMFLWSKYQLTQVAGLAARTCTSAIPALSAGAMDNCGKDMATTYGGLMPPPSWCQGITYSGTVVDFNPPGAPTMSRLVVTISCTGSWLGMVNVQDGVTQGNTSVPVRVQVAMPFLPPTPPI